MIFGTLCSQFGSTIPLTEINSRENFRGLDIGNRIHCVVPMAEKSAGFFAGSNGWAG
jgi:hypothetical protein